MRTRSFATFVAIPLLLGFASTALAQQPASDAPAPVTPPAATSDTPAAGASVEPAQTPVPKGEEPVPGQPGYVQDKHAFGVLPNYRTAEGDLPYSPISARRKFKIATDDTIDGPSFALAGAFSALSQLTGSNPSFHQGFVGYLHRYGTGLLDQDLGNYMTEAIMPSLLHQDPRYFRKAHGSIKGRIAWAASRTVVGRSDSGNWTFNASEFLGNGITAAIGNAYYPDARGFGPTMERMFTQIGTDAISQILKEFWPDVKRKYFHKNDGNLPVPDAVK